MSCNSIPASSSPREEEETEKIRMEDHCIENKQSTAALSSSMAEGNGNSLLKTPAVASTPTPTPRRTTGPIRRAKGGWTPEEDDTLRNAVKMYKGKSWKKIAEFFTDRTEVQCLHRWQKVLNPELVKGPWTQEEDDKIRDLVKKHGAAKWSYIASFLPGRIGKQCRERWHNHLNPDIKKDAWTMEEEINLIKVHQQYGNRWAVLSKFFIGRTDNAIKNHWNSSLKKKLDYYLVHGKLPTNGSRDQDSKQSSDSIAQTCSGTTDLKNPDEDEINHVNSSAIDSSRINLSEYLFSSAMDSKPLPENGNDFGKRLLEMKEECETPMQCHGCSLGTSQVTRPRPRLSTMANEDIDSASRRFTSYLREAASTYKNIPSIIRKRRKIVEEEAEKSNLGKIDTNGEAKEIGREDKEEEVRLNGNAYNMSPPYRLKPKRTAILKSRQLEFLFDKEIASSDETKSS